MKLKGQGAAEISVGDTEEEEKDERFLTDVHGSVCGEIREALIKGEQITDRKNED